MTEFRELGKREILQKYLPDQVNYSYENSTAWKTESIEGRVVYVDETSLWFESQHESVMFCVVRKTK